MPPVELSVRKTPTLSKARLPGEERRWWEGSQPPYQQLVTRERPTAVAGTDGKMRHKLLAGDIFGR